MNEAVKPKTGNENKQPKIPKKKSNYSKYIFALFTALILVIVATGGYIVYTLKQQEVEAQAKYETAVKISWLQSKKSKTKVEFQRK